MSVARGQAATSQGLGAPSHEPSVSPLRTTRETKISAGDTDGAATPWLIQYLRTHNPLSLSTRPPKKMSSYGAFSCRWTQLTWEAYAQKSRFSRFEIHFQDAGDFQHRQCIVACGRLHFHNDQIYFHNQKILLRRGSLEQETFIYLPVAVESPVQESM